MFGQTDGNICIKHIFQQSDLMRKHTLENICLISIYFYSFASVQYTLLNCVV